MASCDKESMRAHTESCIKQLEQNIADGHRTLDPLSKLLNMEMLWANEEEAEGILYVTQAVLNPFGMVHGGCLSSLADTVAGHHIAATGRLCVTLSSSINYLKPAMGEWVRCRSRIRKLGRTVSTLAIEIVDMKGHVVAMASFTFHKMKDITPHIIEKIEEQKNPEDAE